MHSLLLDLFLSYVLVCAQVPVEDTEGVGFPGVGVTGALSWWAAGTGFGAGR